MIERSSSVLATLAPSITAAWCGAKKTKQTLQSKISPRLLCWILNTGLPSITEPTRL